MPYSHTLNIKGKPIRGLSTEALKKQFGPEIKINEAFLIENVWYWRRMAPYAKENKTVAVTEPGKMPRDFDIYPWILARGVGAFIEAKILRSMWVTHEFESRITGSVDWAPACKLIRKVPAEIISFFKEWRMDINPFMPSSTLIWYVLRRKVFLLEAISKRPAIKAFYEKYIKPNERFTRGDTRAIQEQFEQVERLDKFLLLGDEKMIHQTGSMRKAIEKYM